MCGSLTKSEPRAARQGSEPFERGAGVEPDGSGVLGDAPADEPVLHHRLGEHLGGVQVASPASSTSMATRRPWRRRARTSGVRARAPRRRCARSTGCHRRRRRRGRPPRARAPRRPGRRAGRPGGTPPPEGRRRPGTRRAAPAAGSPLRAARRCRHRRRRARGGRRTAPPAAPPAGRWARSRPGRSRPSRPTLARSSAVRSPCRPRCTPSAPRRRRGPGCAPCQMEMAVDEALGHQAPGGVDLVPTGHRLLGDQGDPPWSRPSCQRPGRPRRVASATTGSWVVTRQL